jgi:FKBP-type peptidyl-prolyl cis-trans isomerase FkpA
MKKIPEIALFTGLLSLGQLLNVTPATAQAHKKSSAKVNHANATGSTTRKGESKMLPDGFTLLASGLEYKIVSHGAGKKKPELTDHVELNISYTVGDSVVFDSRKMNNNKPVPIPIAASRGSGDPSEVFMLMVAGDSAVVRFPVDSMKKAGQSPPPWAKDGDKIIYYISMVSVKTDAEDKKETAEKAAIQTGIDDKILQDYFKQRGLKPKKTASGLYYTISTPGHGENVKAGDNVEVNYTGMFMDGKKFDSNTDSSFHHMQPFALEVGRGKVIKGWDEGLQLLNTGAKATFYIPSPLAYGSQDRGPQIPANSILIFDVEILKPKTEAEKKMEMEQKQMEAKIAAGRQVAIDDKTLQLYFAKNNLHPTKTSSGLYYVITQKGMGDNAKTGKKVTMNYTGKLLDGTVFDSNIDPKFGHVQPFTFPLGQGQVIKGWDEGVQLLNMGSKATFFILSSLAYGEHGTGPIPANAVLIFDVELTGN